MNIFEARAKRRKTQWDLRILTGIHQSKISLFENGYVCPSEKERVAIAEALSFPVESIEWPEDKEKRI